MHDYSWNQSKAAGSRAAFLRLLSESLNRLPYSHTMQRRILRNITAHAQRERDSSLQQQGLVRRASGAPATVMNKDC